MLDVEMDGGGRLEPQRLADLAHGGCIAMFGDAPVSYTHLDVYKRQQLVGGIVLHQGRIAEMKTGEGKTLVATLPAYLNALTRCV